MGIEPMTPVLPRLCATAAPHGQAQVGSEGFEPPKAEPTDLQSVPFDRSGNCPGKTPLPISFQKLRNSLPATRRQGTYIHISRSTNVTIITDPLRPVKHFF